MAKVGLSQSFYALYTYDPTATNPISYSNGGTLGKAVDCTIDAGEAEESVFYANNGPAESAKTFNGGTLTITNDSLPLTPMAAILGLEVESIQSPAGSVIKFPANPSTPYVGYATVMKSIVGGVEKWLAIVLNKVKFNVPSDEMTTQGETIEFSGHGLTATIFRDDSADGNWKQIGEFATEANAVTWAKGILSIT